MKQGRLGIRLSAKLLKEAKGVARRKKVTLSHLVQDLLEDAVRLDRVTRDVQSTIDAEQV